MQDRNKFVSLVELYNLKYYNLNPTEIGPTSASCNDVPSDVDPELCSIVFEKGKSDHLA